MTLTKRGVSERVAELRKVISEWDAWQPTPEQRVLYLGRGVKPLGEVVKDAIVELYDEVQTADVEPAAQELVLAIDRFGEEFTKWASDLQVVPEAIPPHGSDEMWDSYRALCTIADRRRPPAPAPPHVLVAQGVTIENIAVRLGWRTEDGRPDRERVNRELSATPEDRQYDPDSWLHPRELRFQKEIQQEFAERCARISLKMATQRPALKDRQPVKQSIEELAELPHMTLRQIALMKRISEDEARAQLDELGYIQTAEGFRRSNEFGRRRRGEVDPEFLLQNDPHDEHGNDIDARIIAIYEDGLKKPKSIADLLSGARNLPVTPQKAAQVIRRHRENAVPT